jgi:proteasome lid subunit RPN8/RPN11
MMPDGATLLVPSAPALPVRPAQRPAPPVQVYLNENVFMGMVLSSVEVFRKECFGLLLGYRADGKYIVEHAIPYQSARRGHNWAELRSDKWKILQDILRNFPRMDILGDYHSHTMYRDVRASVTLSDDDIDYMEPHELQLVVAINQHEHRRASSWAVNGDRTISGWIDRYHIRIAAYYFDHAAGNGHHRGHGPRKAARPRLAEILCPFALGFSR